MWLQEKNYLRITQSIILKNFNLRFKKKKITPQFNSELEIT